MIETPRVVNPDGVPVIPAGLAPELSIRPTPEEAKGKMLLSEATLTLRSEEETRPIREARLLKRKNRRTGLARFQGKVAKSEKGVKLNGRR